MSEVRDEAWLHAMLDEIWDRYFADVPQDNIVKVIYGRRAKTRLGSIKFDRNDHGTTIITMNSLFKDPGIPEFVVRATLVHEMSHYAHGFNSPIEQKFQHPHSGGVMKAEFAERGLEDLYKQQRKWLKDNWRQIIEKHFGPIGLARRRVVRRYRWAR